MGNDCDVDCDGGYQFDLVLDTLTEAIQCSICALLLRDPVELPCSYSFCKICWKRWQKSKTEQLEPTTCPLCNKIYYGNLERESKAMNRFITTVLDVYCHQSNEGCEWIGKIHDYQEHEENNCEYVNVECSYQGCDVELKRKDLEKHEQECQYRFIQCEWCEDEHPIIHMEEHYESCPSYLIPCPNEDCEEEFKRSDKAKMEEHMNTTCEYQEIDCQFHSIGCSEKVLRRLLFDHFEDCVHEHASLMMKELTSLKHEAKRKDKRLMAVENELAVSRKRESELEERIKAIEKKLDEGKAESEGDVESKPVSHSVSLPHVKGVYGSYCYKDYASRFSYILKSMDIDTYHQGDEADELFIKIPMQSDWVCNEFHIYFSDNLPTKSTNYYCDYSSESVAINSGNIWMEVHLKNQELINKDTTLDCYVMYPSLNIKKHVPKTSEGHHFFSNFSSAFFLDMEDKNGKMEELNHIILYIKKH